MNKEYIENRMALPFDPAAESELASEAADYLRNRGIEAPEAAVILGSGLGVYTEMFDAEAEIPYADIPGFARSTAPTHRGTLYYGSRAGKKVLVMAGRFHPYEGYPIHVIVFPIRVMAKLGVKRLIITNAAGAVNFYDNVGSLMLINDHINMSGMNPLIGQNMEDFGSRFPDMSDTYTKRIRETIKTWAAKESILLNEGVYAMMSGPSFETPAEIRFLRTIGADAVGMSTVPEAITACHSGMEVVAFSCLTNPAAGVFSEPIFGEDFTEITRAVAPVLSKLIDVAVSAQ